MSLDARLGDAHAMRHADRELLSLALMQSRNGSLAWLALLEQVPEAHSMAGHIGWWQERWIARNLQRARGPAAATLHAALASIEPRADDWWSTAMPSAPAPGIDILRAYLVQCFVLFRT